MSVSELTLSDLSEEMRDIDFTMLSTRTEGGEIAARPMSNNGDVDYEGDSYFFTYERSRMVTDIKRDPTVSLSFQGKSGLLGKPPLFIAVEGRAELIQDKQAFKEHWTSDLDYWFEKGIETPGIVMIKVHATRIHYWNGEEDGELLI
jgi:general stress protein 26